MFCPAIDWSPIVCDKGGPNDDCCRRPWPPIPLCCIWLGFMKLLCMPWTVLNVAGCCPYAPLKPICCIWPRFPPPVLCCCCVPSAPPPPNIASGSSPASTLPRCTKPSPGAGEGALAYAMKRKNSSSVLCEASLLTASLPGAGDGAIACTEPYKAVADPFIGFGAFLTSPSATVNTFFSISAMKAESGCRESGSDLIDFMV